MATSSADYTAKSVYASGSATRMSRMAGEESAAAAATTGSPGEAAISDPFVTGQPWSATPGKLSAARIAGRAAVFRA